jgi:hypothetical protein
MTGLKSFTIFLLLFSSVALSDFRPVNSKELQNKVAFIPSQCYVKTSVGNNVFNTCYTCHTDSKSPNFMNDADTQLEYGFNKYARRNRWDNLFVDRTDLIKSISDLQIEKYVRTSNYIDSDGLLLRKDLENLPEEWDGNGNGEWDGYLPDSYFNFDADGFDRSPNNDYTGWRSFIYVPFPGSFVPAAGSTDDVLIRLPTIFRLNNKGKFDIETYKMNLTIVESLLKQESIKVPVVDELRWGVDLNFDGILSKTSLVSFKSNLIDGSGMFFVGKAGEYQKQGKIRLAAGLYPVGTEFLHSVRYLDIVNGNVVMAPRMKELRYAKKIGWAPVIFHEEFAIAEAQERTIFPDQIPLVKGGHEKGVVNGLGWRFQGFIESGSGSLRPQNYEEHVFCVGCHSAIGAIDDSTFSFSRKYNGYLSGWGGWSGSALSIVFSDHVVKVNYLDYFNTAGNVTDLSEKSTQKIGVKHLLPNKYTAFQLNKAYKTIVNDQSFVKGRDANLETMEDIVHRIVRPGQKTKITVEKVSLF